MVYFTEEENRSNIGEHFKMSDETFTTSVDAQRIARALVNFAREEGFVTGPVLIAPEAAAAEKELFVKMFAELPRHKGNMADGGLSGEQISSLFTFVFAKAAETAAQLYEGVADIHLSTEGMLSGNVPIAAGELLNDFSADQSFPDRCMTTFLDQNAEAPFSAPLLALFEALKWCYRLSFHIFWNYLEEQSNLK